MKFYFHVSTLILAWISDHMSNKVRNEVTYQFLNLAVGYAASSYTQNGCNLTSMPVIKITPCHWKGPQAPYKHQASMASCMCDFEQHVHAIIINTLYPKPWKILKNLLKKDTFKWHFVNISDEFSIKLHCDGSQVPRVNIGSGSILVPLGNKP